MDVFLDLFGSLSGLLSLFVIIFTTAMGFFCGYLFISKMNNEAPGDNSGKPST
jgi:hypothetical protein